MLNLVCGLEHWVRSLRRDQLSAARWGGGGAVRAERQPRGGPGGGHRLSLACALTRAHRLPSSRGLRARPFAFPSPRRSRAPREGGVAATLGSSGPADARRTWWKRRGRRRAPSACSSASRSSRGPCPCGRARATGCSSRSSLACAAASLTCTANSWCSSSRTSAANTWTCPRASR